MADAKSQRDVASRRSRLATRPLTVWNRRRPEGRPPGRPSGLRRFLARDARLRTRL